MNEEAHCSKCRGPVEVGYLLHKSLHVTAQIAGRNLP